MGGEKNSSSDWNEIETLLIVAEGSNSEPRFHCSCEEDDFWIETDPSGYVVDTPAGLLVSLISSLFEISPDEGIRCLVVGAVDSYLLEVEIRSQAAFRRHCVDASSLLLLCFLCV
jgi:hypothetical protein